MVTGTRLLLKERKCKNCEILLMKVGHSDLHFHASALREFLVSIVLNCVAAFCDMKIVNVEHCKISFSLMLGLIFSSVKYL